MSTDDRAAADQGAETYDGPTMDHSTPGEAPPFPADRPSTDALLGALPGLRYENDGHDTAPEALDALRERIAIALYDGNEAFHAALAHERGQEYQRISRPPWIDTHEYYRALYLARADAALAALGITVADPDHDAVRVAVHSILDRLGAEADDPEDGAR